MRAFCTLLQQRPYSSITVQEIIDTANIGRTTFYAHFETKEYLLQALCHDLFDHIENYKLHDRSDPHTVFMHLFSHLKRNDNNVLDLLSSSNNAIFVPFFKMHLKKLIQKLFLQNDRGLSAELVSGCIAAAFVETAAYWIGSDMTLSEQEITDCFMKTIGHILL